MKKQLAFVLILGLIAASIPGAFAQDDMTGLAGWSECEEDLTGETINFYHFGDLSGVYTFITLPLLAGFSDMAAYINANGGLCGAEVAQVYEDTGGERERSQAAWDKLSANDDAYIMYIYSSDDGDLLRDQSAEAEIPLINAAALESALYSEEGEPGWQFSYTPLYTDQLGAFCDYVSDEANREALGIEGEPSIGYISWPNAFGLAADSESAWAYCESVGVTKAGDSQLFLPSAADISPLITNLLDAGANILYTNTLASGPAAIASTVGAMNLDNPPLVAGSNWVLDTSVIGLAGENAFGVVGNLPYLWWDEIENPGIQLATALWVENRLSKATDEASTRAALGTRNIAYLAAQALMDMNGEVMIRTINRVGYENLTGAAVYETLSELQYEPMGGVLSIDWTNGQRTARRTRIGTITLVEGPQGTNPGILPVSDWFDAPDLRTVGGADTP